MTVREKFIKEGDDSRVVIIDDSNIDIAISSIKLEWMNIILGKDTYSKEFESTRILILSMIKSSFYRLKMSYIIMSTQYFTLIEHLDILNLNWEIETKYLFFDTKEIDGRLFVKFFGCYCKQYNHRHYIYIKTEEITDTNPGSCIATGMSRLLLRDFKSTDRYDSSATEVKIDRNSYKYFNELVFRNKYYMTGRNTILGKLYSKMMNMALDETTFKDIGFWGVLIGELK